MGGGGFAGMSLLPGIFSLAAGAFVCGTADLEPTDT